jgi:hypothetical protein
MDGDHGQKGMVGMTKDVVVTILELDKRERLMSLLECGDHMVRWNKRWYNAIAYCTGITIFGIISIGVIIIWHGTWVQFHDPIDS